MRCGVGEDGDGVVGGRVKIRQPGLDGISGSVASESVSVGVGVGVHARVSASLILLVLVVLLLL